MIPWAFVLEETRLDSSYEEDPKTRKKRLQAKLVTSVETLKIKPVSFFSLVSKGKTEELRQLLNKSVASCSSEALNNERELTHIHEGYQFLIKTFVSSDEGLEEGIVLDEWSIKLKTMERRRSMKISQQQSKPVESSNRRGSRTSLGSDDNDSLDSRQSRCYSISHRFKVLALK